MSSKKFHGEGFSKNDQTKNTKNQSNLNNHITGYNNSIKDNENNIHANNSNFNNSNNTYINHNYNSNIASGWKKFIKSMFPSKKHSNTHNIIIGWVSILVNLGLIIVTVVSVITTLRSSDSNQNSSNSLIASQPPTAALSAPTTSSSPYTSTTSSPPLTPSVQTVSPLPSNSLSSKTEDSPTPATRPEGSPPGRISVEFSDTPSTGEKIGRDKYQISSSGHVGLRVGWSSISYNNTVSSNDCEVVLTSSGPAPVKGEIRTAKCTDTYGTSLEFSEPGEYTISVDDKQSGNTGSRVIQIVK